MLKAATIALNGNRPGVCDEDYRGIICWPWILELAAPSQNRAKTLEIPKPGRNHRNKICPHGFISAGQIKSSVCVFISVIACGSWVKQVCPLVGLACVTPQLQKLSTRVRHCVTVHTEDVSMGTIIFQTIFFLPSVGRLFWCWFYFLNNCRKNQWFMIVFVFGNSLDDIGILS